MAEATWYEVVKRRLREQGLHQEDLVGLAEKRWGRPETKKIGFTTSSLSRALNGGTPRPELVAAIVLLLDLDPQELGLGFYPEWKLGSEVMQRFGEVAA